MIIYGIFLFLHWYVDQITAPLLDFQVSYDGGSYQQASIPKMRQELWEGLGQLAQLVNVCSPDQFNAPCTQHLSLDGNKDSLVSSEIFPSLCQSFTCKKMTRPTASTIWRGLLSGWAILYYDNTICKCIYLCSLRLLCACEPWDPMWHCQASSLLFFYPL